MTTGILTQRKKESMIKTETGNDCERKQWLMDLYHLTDPPPLDLSLFSFGKRYQPKRKYCTVFKIYLAFLLYANWLFCVPTFVLKCMRHKHLLSLSTTNHLFNDLEKGGGYACLAVYSFYLCSPIAPSVAISKIPILFEKAHYCGCTIFTKSGKWWGDPRDIYEILKLWS